MWNTAVHLAYFEADTCIDSVRRTAVGIWVREALNHHFGCLTVHNVPTQCSSIGTLADLLPVLQVLQEDSGMYHFQLFCL